MNHHLLDHNWAHQPLFLSQNSFGRVDFSFLLFAFSLLLLHHLQLVPICHGFWSFPNRNRHLWSSILKHKDIKCPPVCWHRDDPGWESKEGRCHKCSPLAASPPPDASLSWSGSSCLLNCGQYERSLCLPCLRKLFLNECLTCSHLRVTVGVLILARRLDPCWKVGYFFTSVSF